MASTGFDGRVDTDPKQDPSLDPTRQKTEPRTVDFQLPQIVRDNPQASMGMRVRRLIRWRVPGAGFIDMFINPQQMQIQERKIIKRSRTKGGYVAQYWGEELPIINISGTTASAGIEGINILRSVYRSEQDAFGQVAKSLADELGVFTIGGSVGTSAPLYPTLASLAVGVEMFYQGWVFKGYFENFTITESVSIGPGVFEYAMTFIVTDRRGIRKNFIDWHREPATVDKTGRYGNFRSSDSASVPPSFREEK